MSRDDVFRAGLLFLFLCYNVESCVQRKVQAKVPETLKPGYVICKVDLERCDVSHLHLTSSDPDFTIQTDGTILTVHVTTVPNSGKSFWITVQDHNGHRWMVDVSLSLTDQETKSSVHKRTKRRWSPPPIQIPENDPGPFPKNVELIGSDSSANYSVYYTIDGPGVTANPVNLFSIERTTGMLRVHKSIDREQYPQIKFIAHAFDMSTSVERDKPLDVTVIVLDKNDNAPEFVNPLFFSVEEQAQGILVGQVNATDKDDPKTDHTRIKYTLINGTNLFNIGPYTGLIQTTTDTLDREIQEKIVFEVEIRDMAGLPSGLFSRGMAVVTLTDINDNPPTFKEDKYKAQVMENLVDQLILRIPVEDKDLKNTPNWKAVYEITKGNETGDFLIKTDPVTNEGLLYVKKPQDYEKKPTLNLEVMALNEVPLKKSRSTWQKVPVQIDVGDVDEGPEFSAPIMQMKVKENVPSGTLIGTYTAIDPETKSSSGIKYFKLKDPASWVNVVANTGELRTEGIIDRESPFVFNGIYNITVKAVDKSQMSGTGTVMILIEDVNDNIPIITNSKQIMCSQLRTPRSIVIEAFDADNKPFSDPYSFELGKEAEKSWIIKGHNSTSAIMEQIVDLPNNEYKIPVIVKDLQGTGKEQIVSVRVCKCLPDGTCPWQKVTSKFGSLGILALLMSLLLLLLLSLLLLCACKGNKKEKHVIIPEADYPDAMLLKSNVEAPGEEVKSFPVMMDNTFLENQTVLSTGHEYQSLKRDLQQNNTQGFMTNTSSTGQFGTGQFGTGQFGTGQFGTGQFGTGQFYSSSMQKNYSSLRTIDAWAVADAQLRNKLHCLENQDERFAEDILKPYGYEGMGSPTGSVGCCSTLTDQDKMDFLDSLGPKFKTLADISKSKK